MWAKTREEQVDKANKVSGIVKCRTQYRVQYYFTLKSSAILREKYVTKMLRQF